jgi:hypothetical protein
MRLADVQPGQRIVRLIGEEVEVTITVEAVSEGFIYARGGWKFRRDNGAEVDEALGWDGLAVTGSRLIRLVGA